MREIIRLLLLFHVLCLGALGQDSVKTIERNLWRSRADIVTNNLLKDAANAEALDRALLLAQLSSLWWESERNQANTWLEKSVDAIAFYPSEEAREQSEKYFRITRQVLALVSTHNKKQSTRLVDILSKSEKVIPDKEKKLNAESLIEQALIIVKTDAAEATKLGLRAIALEFPTNAHKLAWELRRYDSALADKFYGAALSNFSTAPELTKLFVLWDIVFPERGNPDFPAQFLPPRELRISFLSFVAEYLQQQQLAFSSKQVQSCSDVGVFATRLRNHFAELLPQKAPVVEQAIEICLSNINPEIKKFLNPRSAEITNAEELLKQADGIQGDPLLRGRYLLQAALILIHQKKFASCIQVLERMNEEERKVDSDFWEDIRLDAGAALAVTEFKEGDVPRAHKTLKAIPDALRSLGQVTFVLQISPQDMTCSQFCVDLLNDARRDIVKSDRSFIRKTTYWLLLVKLYSDYKLQTEAAGVFREMVIAFNSARTDANASDALATQLIADAKRTIPRFSLALFETKEDSLFESVRLLNDEKARTEINLELLRMILQRYQSK